MQLTWMKKCSAFVCNAWHIPTSSKDYMSAKCILPNMTKYRWKKCWETIFSWNHTLLLLLSCLENFIFWITFIFHEKPFIYSKTVTNVKNNMLGNNPSLTCRYAPKKYKNNCFHIFGMVSNTKTLRSSLDFAQAYGVNISTL